MMAVHISLPQGAHTVIDEADFGLVGSIKWQLWTNGDHRYARTSIRRDGKKSCVSMHRMLFGFPPISLTVDHIDGDGLNNQRSNLRLVSRGQNRSNSIKRREAACSFKGVAKKEMKWAAQISATDQRLDSTPWYIGTFDTAADAARAYDAVARILFGQHARVNFPRKGEQCATLPNVEPA